MTAPLNIVLTEWQTRRPDSGSGLEGRLLGDPADRAVAAELATAGLLEVTELRAGLSVQSFSQHECCCHWPSPSPHTHSRTPG